MTQQPGPERGDEPGVDLGKPRPGASQQPPPSPSPSPPPAGAGWGSAPPPPPGGPGVSGGYPPPTWQGQPAPGQGWPGQAQPWPGRVGVGARPASSDEQFWGGAAHWSAIVMMVVAMAFLGPLIVLLVKGNDSPWVRRQAAESLNFQVTILIAAVVSGMLILVGIGLLLLPLVGLAWLVFTIIGSIKASAGEDYRYPLTLRMVR